MMIIKPPVLTNDTMGNNVTSEFHDSVKLHLVTPQFIAEQTVKMLADRMDIIRAIAIFSVIWGHCLSGLELRYFTNPADKLIQVTMLQAGRIGTVMFFLISGFLLNEKIEKLSLSGYLKYRFNSVILPWLIFVTIVVIIQLFHIYSTQAVYSGGKIHLIFNLFKSAIFHAAYWFIPVTIVSALVLIAFKKYIRKTEFGILLSSITIFYGVNLYYNWIPATHTEAFLGYALFLWIGMYIKAHIKTVLQIIDSLSWYFLIPLLLFSFMLASREGMLLTYSNSTDPYGSIRLSNTILSIVLFFILIKSKRLGWLKKIKPQENIYGIYLVHCIVIMLLTSTFNHFTNQASSGLLQLVVSSILMFIVILSSSYLIVSLINRTPFCFMIGRKRPPRPTNT